MSQVKRIDEWMNRKTVEQVLEVDLNRKALKCTALLISMFGVVGTSACSDPNDSKDHLRSAIELCWEDQGKNSNDPVAAKFIAGACERLERELQALG